MGELEKVVIIRAIYSPFNFPVWPVEKPDCTWRMTVDYWELSKVIPLIHAAFPSVIDLMDWLTNELGTYHFVADLEDAFFSIDIAPESQDQFPPHGKGGSGPLQCSFKGICTALLNVTCLWQRT